MHEKSLCCFCLCTTYETLHTNEQNCILCVKTDAVHKKDTKVLLDFQFVHEVVSNPAPRTDSESQAKLKTFPESSPNSCVKSDQMSGSFITFLEMC